MKNPWMKFYPTDWRADPRLKMCSREARSLWIDMLCLMHEAEPYGHLVVCGHPLTDATLAALTGDDVSTISRLRTELENFGVFSRNGEGVIYSRRMTRDFKKAKNARKNGKSGGNPILCNDEDIPASVNPQVNPEDKGGVKPQILEARKKDYWWGMEVIKLTRRDFDRLKALYPGSEEQFVAYLTSRDKWYRGQPPEIRKSWFMATESHIKSLANQQGETA